MTQLESIFLGIVQGLTEFLPVSSSGHLTILEHLFSIETNLVFFNVAVHAGTLVATLIYFRKKLLNLTTSALSGDASSLRYILLIFIASVPAGIVGILLSDTIDRIFASTILVGVGYIITTAALFYLSHKFSHNDSSHEDAKQLTFIDALIIGIFQAVAIIPGVSRSGLTIVAGAYRKLDIDEAFDFSFILSIPAISGALLLQASDVASTTHAQAAVIGGVVACISGYGALIVFKKVLSRKRIKPFMWYCFSLALFIILISYT